MSKVEYWEWVDCFGPLWESGEFVRTKKPGSKSVVWPYVSGVLVHSENDEYRAK